MISQEQKSENLRIDADTLRELRKFCVEKYGRVYGEIEREATTAIQNKKIEYNIIECCAKFHAHYIPILKNKFRILTEDSNITFSREDGTHSSDLNVKIFVSIYKCVQNREKKRRSLFGKKNITPYSGELLDNLFFKNVMSFCQKNNIELKYLRYLSNFLSEDTVTYLDEMKNIFNQMVNVIVVGHDKLSHRFQQDAGGN